MEVNLVAMDIEEIESSKKTKKATKQTKARKCDKLTADVIFLIKKRASYTSWGNSMNVMPSIDRT